MGVIADAMNRLFDLLTAPFGGAAAWAMALLSSLCGAGLMLLFKVTTRQQKLAEARRRLTGLVYELGLFRDDLGVMLRIQRDLAVANLRFLWLTLPALVALTIPALLILPQFEARFARRPLSCGEWAVVTARVAPGQAPVLETLALAASPGVAIETPPVRDREALTAMWRVRVREAGRHELTVRDAAGNAWTKRLEADGGLPRLAVVRKRASLRAALFNPGERPLPRESVVASLAVTAPSRQTRYGGLRLSWLAAFCVFSLTGALAVKVIFRIEV